MKKIFAALTAITIAAGLSLAAVVAPASADDAPAPNPVASTSPDTTSADTTSDPTPSSTPTTAPDPTPDATSTPPAAPESTPRSFSVTSVPQKTYDVVLWKTDTYNVKYPQTKVSVTNQTTISLPPLPTTCGTSYQEDIYVHGTDEAKWLSKTNTLAGPDGAQDGSFLAPGGNGVAYTYVVNAVCPPPCIPDSSVSYTYSGNDANSGDITVPTVKGSSGQLCKPFYVTATSWSYTTNSVWPQVIDKVNHVNGTPVGGSDIAISASGVYHYAAQITCGQGDIYASWTSNASTLFPENDNLPGTGYLAGPGDPLAEHFLHDMGFSGPNPTYHQDNTNCWTPTPETGVPTTTTLTCANGSANTLTLPAIPGGVWKVTNGAGGSHYTATYPIGTGVTNWVPTNFNGAYTITLVDGNSHDGYNVTGTSTPWSPQNPYTLDCNVIVTPETPTSLAIQQCGVDGSIWIPNTAGVQYYLDGNKVGAGTINGLHGNHTVTATALDGYKFAPGTQYNPTVTEWKFSLGVQKECPVSISVGTCTADGPVSSVPVSIDLDNTSGNVSSSFVVNINGAYFDTFVVPASTKVTKSLGSSGSAGEEVEVYINGSQNAVIKTVDKFSGCQIVLPADPSITQDTCNLETGTLSNDASLTVDLIAGVSYSVTGPNGYTLNDVTGTSGLTVVATGLAPGDYVVTVTATGGYVLDPTITAIGSQWPFHVNIPSTECFGVFVSATPADCPQVDQPEIRSAGFTATSAGVPSITVNLNANVVYTAYLNGSSIGQVLTQTTTDVSPGAWVVRVTLSASAPAYYHLPANVEFGPFDLNAFCPPPLATWHAGATGSNAQCTDGTTTDGVITLVHDDPDETGKITYKITNTVTNAVVYNSNLDNAVHVPAGSYSVEATPPVGDGISGNLQNLPGGAEIFPTITIGTSSTNCDPGRLAFTGGTIAWFGFVLAGGMLFLGIAFLLMRRRQGGITE